jgi:dTDP-glucose 4,6-dehydratase
MVKRLLVTGGAGFIGSNFVRYILSKHPSYQVVVLDKLTYAGNLANLADVAGNPKYRFVRGDICDQQLVDGLMAEVDAVINFAAETHVDRSILDAGGFIQTDVYGTFVLLEAMRKHKIQRFLQVSTDEVYGDIPSGSSVETDPFRPRSPYSASKAGGEMMVQAYHVTYELPVLITRGSNNYGPYQYPEKLIPVLITNALDDKDLPIYGDGLQIRDWLYVMDHCSAIDVVLHEGQIGESYNIGGGNERVNLDIAGKVLDQLNKPRTLLKYVKDRPGHDRRYSLDCTKLKRLGWAPARDFEEGLAETVQWYVENQAWWRPLKSGEYWEYYKKNYRSL